MARRPVSMKLEDSLLDDLNYLSTVSKIRRNDIMEIMMRWCLPVFVEEFKPLDSILKEALNAKVAEEARKSPPAPSSLPAIRLLEGHGRPELPAKGERPSRAAEGEGA